MSWKVKDVLFVEDLADLFDLPSPVQIEERISDYTADVFHYVYKESLAEGATEEEAEKSAQEAEDESAREQYALYAKAVEQVAEREFGEHGLILVPLKKGGFKVHPEESWRAAADKLIDTINGCR